MDGGVSWTPLVAFAKRLKRYFPGILAHGGRSTPA